MPDVHEHPIPVYPVTPDTSPILPVTATVGIAPEQASLFPENEPVQEPQEYTPETEAFSAVEIPDIPAPPAPEAVKEKVDFGFTGLVFALITIGVLSIACGVFAFLYFGGF
jgi:hypothetical protein